MKTRFLLVVFFFAGRFLSNAQDAERIIYSVKEKDTLWFDRYLPQENYNNSTIVFVHGGAFTGGHPDNQKPLAVGMSKLGYQVIVLKYRLYLKGKSFGCETNTTEKLKAIHTAIEDIHDATAFLINSQEGLKIDTSKIFLAGSSAGAEAVLNMVFDPFTNRKVSAGSHPYKSVLSFAGAVLDLSTLDRNNKIPLFLMHGTNDQLVPYAIAPHRYCKASDEGWMMMFGAESIFKAYQNSNAPAVLYAYKGKGHEVSNYMFREFEKMDEFIKAVVNGTVKISKTEL